MVDGTVLTADIILTGCSPYHTFVELMGTQDQENLESDTNNIKSKNNNSRSENSQNEISKFQHHVEHTDFSCGAFKINLAVDKLPNFSSYPSPKDGSVGPMHRGTFCVSAEKFSRAQYSKCCFSRGK